MVYFFSYGGDYGMVENSNGNHGWKPADENEKVGARQIGFVNSYIGRKDGSRTGDFEVLDRTTGKLQIVCSFNTEITRSELDQVFGKKQ